MCFFCISLSCLADITCHSHAKTALQEYVTWDRCGGPPRLQHQSFHIPLTDHGCKRIQVQSNSKSFLWLSQQSFSRKAVGRLAPSGPRLECAVGLYRFSLSSLLDCPIKRSNWSDPMGSCFQMCKSVVRERDRETQGV